MDTLNPDLKLELSRYLFNANIYVWLKLFELDTSIYPAMLYTLRLYRIINNMQRNNNFNTMLYSLQTNNVDLQKCNDNDCIMEIVAYMKYNRKLPQTRDFHRAIQSIIDKNYDIKIIKPLAAKSSNKDFTSIITHMIFNIMSGKYMFPSIIKFLAAESTNKDFITAIMLAIPNTLISNRLIAHLIALSSNTNFVAVASLALEYGRYEILKYLMMQSSNQNFIDLINKASRSKDFEMVKYLAPLSSNKDFVNIIHNTVYSKLHLWSLYDLSIALYLSSQSSNKNFTDIIDLALSSGNNELIEFANKLRLLNE